ncbi:MAG: DinB family protein [Chloroflexi bacterium]|nr:DinB family protein [Chloroflexota bacterium]
MPTLSDGEALVRDLDTAVQEACVWFEGPGRTARARVGEWGPREVLSHFLFWHQLTLEGIESVAKGGQPRMLESSPDEMNAKAVAAQAGKDIPMLVAQFRSLQQQLGKAARTLASLDTVIRVRPDGTRRSAGQQLELMATHVREHLQELQAVAKPGG